MEGVKLQNHSLRPEVDVQRPIGGVIPISASELLMTGTQEVFDVFERPGHLTLFHPFCRENFSTEWNEGNRHDVLIYLNGLQFVRNFISWQRPFGFDLLIGEPGQRQSLVGWRLKPISESSSRLTITVYPHLLHGFSSVASYPIHKLWLRPKLQDYLSSVVAGLQFYLITEKSTPRNAFGSHPWFS